MGQTREVRINQNVVERPAKPWTPTVHALLKHLHGSGLPVPEPISIRGGLEYVTLIPGEAGVDAWDHQLSHESVRSAGQLLRRVHDATVGWEPPADVKWAVPFSAGDVICHGDPQPANFAWRDGVAVGLFDWDVARPGDRLSDVAYALEWFTPFEDDPTELRARGFDETLDRAARIRAFLDGYGWDGPLDVVSAVTARQKTAIDEVVYLGSLGHQPQSEWVAAGWPDRWTAKLATTRRVGTKLSV
ncbi:phosphotransferase enzyme family protein [Arthrobacter sp. MAHUQ-56]